MDTLMIVASIIEAETEVDTEMDTIASVYYNRIERGIPLQSDPTVLYYMDEEDLRKFKNSEPGAGKVWRYYKDTINSPYNTYKHMIPPTPINSPGLSAIKASIYPAVTDYIFMYSPSALSHHIFNTEENFDKHIKAYKND